MKHKKFAILLLGFISGIRVQADTPPPRSVTATLLSGTAIVGKVGIDQTTPGTTNGVVVNSSALPTGASTSANQSTEITALGTINTSLAVTQPRNVSQIGGNAINTGIGTAGTGTQRVAVSSDSSITANAGTNLNTSALATSANLTAGTAKVQMVDASGNVAPVGDTVGRSPFVKVTDGTNTQAVKAASTAAVATDPAAVVAISPNTPISTKTPLTGNVVFTVSVGTGATTVLAANSVRKGANFTNTSNNIISCAFSATTPVLRSGITLYPGGSFWMDEYSFTTGAISCIASAAASSLAGQEFQ